MELDGNLIKGCTLTRFVVNYNRMRPEYPNELFEDVFKYSGSKK